MNSFHFIIIIILISIIIYLLFERKKVDVSKSVNTQPSDEECIDDTEFEFIDELESIHQFDKINYKSITKNLAISIINQYSNSDYLTTSNTSFSNINKAVPLWWFNIAPEKFEQDLNLILAKTNGFIWIKLPAGSVSNPKRKFRFRDDKGLIEIKISPQPGFNYLRDESSGGIGFGFQQYIKKEFKN